MILNKQQKEWRAEEDAYTLISAEAIKADTARKSAALKKVKKLAVDKEKEAKAAKKVATTLKSGKPTSQNRKNKKK